MISRKQNYRGHPQRGTTGFINYFQSIIFIIRGPDYFWFARMQIINTWISLF